VEFFSAEFFYALGTIILIDLVLAGDNAIVIALAARNLPPAHQKKAILWGTVGAIVVRTIMTVAVVWLLKIPGLLFVGGAALIYIAIKLLVPDANEGDSVDHAANSFWGAMKTIVVADAVMGLDNVLGVAGAAQGNFLLVVLGLLISIPIVVWGSTMILKWVEKYPWIMYVGAAVLAVTSAKMMWSEPMIQPYLAQLQFLKWPFILAITAFVVAMGLWFNRKQIPASPSNT
jgi:YjbE family integral membrane protein